MISAGGSSRFLLPFRMQQHMAKQIAMTNNEIAHDPLAIIIIGNFPIERD